MQKKTLVTFFLLGLFLLLPSFANAACGVNDVLISSSDTFPLTLNQVSKTYCLTSDISSNETALIIAGNDIGLNLDGHEIVYDNAPQIQVPNGSFENSLSGTWDLANAPDASQVVGTFIGSTVSAYDPDYNPDAPATIHSLAFSLPAADQFVESANTVTLEANTTYSLSAMFRNSGNSDSLEGYAGGVRDNLSMSIEIEGTAYKATSTGVTWRGFQFTNIVFTTGSSAVIGKVKISIANAGSVGIGQHAYVDDVRILKANSYGVNVGPNFIGSQRFIITNGKITQGQGNGFASNAINVGQAWDGYTISNLELTTQGVNSKAIYGQAAQNSSVHDLLIHHNVKTIKSRDQYDGAAIHINYSSNANTYGSEFYNITIPTGIQTGISVGHSNSIASCITGVDCPVCSTGDGCPSLIYDNSITLQSRYTNDFAIVGDGNHIYRNTVDCGTLGNGCRGIIIAGNGTRVYDNVVGVQDLGISQEYNGCEGSSNGGVYGMQGEHIASNVEVFGNIVTANATNTCAANALRLNTSNVIADDTFSMNIHGNTFIANATGTPKSYVMRLGGFHNQPRLLIHDNIFKTNSVWIFHDYNNYPAEEVTLTHNTFQELPNLQNPFTQFRVSEYQMTNPNTYTFVDNMYSSGNKTSFESSCWYGLYTGTCSSYGSSVFQQSDFVAPSAPNGLSVL